MGEPYLADSNVLIDFLMNRLPKEGAELMIELLNTKQLAVSVISKIEVLGYNGDPDDLKQFRVLLSRLTLLPLDDAVTERTITLRKTFKIKLPDAIIAATALHHNQILLTRNLKDFNRIERLVCENLHKHT